MSHFMLVMQHIYVAMQHGFHCWAEWGKHAPHWQLYCDRGRG